MSEIPLQESIWWMIPGQLAGLRKPAASERDVLRAAGIGAIVSVMDDPSNLDWYKSTGIPHRWLPTTGGTAPTREQVQKFVDFAQTQIAKGHAVAVHCSSGRRRTATFLGAYLILQGASYKEVVEAIAQANPTVEMRAAQLDFLKALAERSPS
ncbi:MAG: dual specificity protein phosphatase family protein [Cyanobacteria bacterium P01_H01_bin.119]